MSSLCLMRVPTVSQRHKENPLVRMVLDRGRAMTEVSAQVTAPGTQMDRLLLLSLLSGQPRRWARDWRNKVGGMMPQWGENGERGL
ncbi:hypothetical protein EYF80_009505 [Liparis tanakae]|uniref:Uncharacterized protein n=1 Tax=Liparis tanakae TaxID=230148 RepID=A0A4Z2IQA6_9TELE|nr:hypothetical protein EYF80_009505 [Liparis tanakae]